MSDHVVPGHSTYGKPHSPFYEGDHENDNLPFLSEGIPFTQRAIPQGDPLGIWYKALNPSILAGESTKWANLPI